jgi:putative ABC transport system permease protein
VAKTAKHRKWERVRFALPGLSERLRRHTGVAAFFVVRVLRRDPGFIAFTVAVCAIAAIVASFQYTVFTSFLRAGSAGPDAIGGDVWVVARGVECFDFPTPIPEDYAGALARYLPGVRFRRVVVGFSPWRSPIGRRSSVTLIGVDALGLSDRGFIADQSDLQRLSLSPGQPGRTEASIGDVTVDLERVETRLATFVGAPYILSGLETAREVLGWPSTDAAYLVADLRGGLPVDFTTRRAEAAKAFPEVELLSREEFARSSSHYWQSKTGAGAAVLLGAALAGLLMIVLLVNAIGRFIQRYERDLLSLLGHGADNSEVLAIVVMTAAAISGLTLALGLVLTPLAVALGRPFLPWVKFRLSDMAIPSIAMAFGFCAAVLAAHRAISTQGPEVVFRT